MCRFKANPTPYWENISLKQRISKGNRNNE
nr:MAG TPA: hypothetical protein [Caudoviricetes sp.]